jgi:hypothetical protein
MRSIESSLPARSLLSKCVHSEVRGSRLEALDNTIQSAIATMRLLRSLLPSLLLVGSGVVQAVSSWGFDEAVLTISSTDGKGGKPTYQDKYVELCRKLIHL